MTAEQREELRMLIDQAQRTRIAEHEQRQREAESWFRRLEAKERRRRRRSRTQELHVRRLSGEPVRA